MQDVAVHLHEAFGSEMWLGSQLLCKDRLTVEMLVVAPHKLGFVLS